MSEAAKVTLIVQDHRRGWLQEDGSFGPESSAAKFTFRASPTGIDVRRCERDVQRWCGQIDGTPNELGAWLDRQRALSQARAQAWGILGDIIGIDSWKATDDEDETAFQRRKDAALEAAWPTCDDPAFRETVQGLATLQGDMDELAMWARWAALQVSVPAGWKVVQDHPRYESLRGILLDAWAQLWREADAGKR